jgi:hypothetical protein
MRKRLLIALFAAPLALLPLPAMAQAGTPPIEIAPELDQNFWCAAAYGVASVRANAEGQVDVATTLLSYSQALANFGKQTMLDGGTIEEEADRVALSYFDEVLAQFNGEAEPRFTPSQCRVLVEPFLVTP